MHAALRRRLLVLLDCHVVLSLLVDRITRSIVRPIASRARTCRAVQVAGIRRPRCVAARYGNVSSNSSSTSVSASSGWSASTTSSSLSSRRARRVRASLARQQRRTVSLRRTGHVERLAGSAGTPAAPRRRARSRSAGRPSASVVPAMRHAIGRRPGDQPVVRRAAARGVDVPSTTPRSRASAKASKRLARPCRRVAGLRALPSHRLATRIADARSHIGPRPARCAPTGNQTLR